MAKYNWNKHKKIKFGFNEGQWNGILQSENIYNLSSPRRVHPAFIQHGPADITPLRGATSDLVMYDENSYQSITDRIRESLEMVTEQYIGHINDDYTVHNIANTITNQMNIATEQELIRPDFDVRVDGQGNVNLTIVPVQGLESINMQISLDDLGGH